MSFRFISDTKDTSEKYETEAHMAKSWASRHDGGLIDGHRIFSKIGNDGMAGLMVRCNRLVLFVNFNTSPLRPW